MRTCVTFMVATQLVALPEIPLAGTLVQLVAACGIPLVQHIVAPVRTAALLTPAKVTLA